MPIQVQLADGKTLELSVDLDAWRKAFERALDLGDVVEIENRRGEVLAINPLQVQYWTPASEWDEEAWADDTAGSAGAEELAAR